MRRTSIKKTKCCEASTVGTAKEEIIKIAKEIETVGKDVSLGASLVVALGDAILGLGKALENFANQLEKKA